MADDRTKWMVPSEEVGMLMFEPTRRKDIVKAYSMEWSQLAAISEPLDWTKMTVDPEWEPPWTPPQRDKTA
jgi:hypothetical protein